MTEEIPVQLSLVFFFKFCFLLCLYQTSTKVDKAVVLHVAGLPPSLELRESPQASVLLMNAWIFHISSHRRKKNMSVKFSKLTLGVIENGCLSRLSQSVPVVDL